MSNSALDNCKQSTLAYVKSEFGIVYCATNTVTGHKYVGSTLATLHRRKYRHERERTCLSIYDAIQKYGSNNFTWEILENTVPKHLLVIKENEWIDKLQTMNPMLGYNLRKSGKGGCANNITKKRHSLGQINRYKDPSQRAKTAEAMKRQYADIKMIAKHSLARGGRPFEAFKDGQSYGVFITYKQAAETLGMSISGVNYVLKGLRNSSYGFTFKYVKENEYV
jgi:group I intron endonuclease